LGRPGGAEKTRYFATARERRAGDPCNGDASKRESLPENDNGSRVRRYFNSRVDSDQTSNGFASFLGTATFLSRT
jgi:hypothetical protein